MDIACSVTDCGLQLRIDDRVFDLNFPREVWQSFPDKELFADNYAFLKSLHLPEMLDRWELLEFETSYPLFKEQFLWALLNNISFCADVDSRPVADEIRKFMALDVRFRDHEIRFPRARPALSERAVLNMSFGKDSLLTWAVAREIGLPTTLVMSVENDSPIEFGHKQDIAKRFSETFAERIWLVENNTGVIHRYEYWGTPHTESGFGHLITEYFLSTLPFAFHHGARYILLGNEKSCDDTYVGRDGYRCYPVYDQTSEWMLEMSKMGTVLANDRMHVMSLIEPLHDLAIIRILHTRYPEVGRFQMSCFPDENEHGRRHFWCGHCTKCARSFVHLVANGIDPRSMGLDTDMFGQEFQHLFTVFGGKRTVGMTVGYDASLCGRDEQLLAFYMARQQGARGPLIDLFETQLLDEARARNAELEARFLSVQPSRSLPSPWRERVEVLYADAIRA